LKLIVRNIAFTSFCDVSLSTFVCVKMHLWAFEEVQSLADLASACCCVPRCNHIRCRDLHDAGCMPADVAYISGCHFNLEVSALAFRYMSLSSATMLHKIALSEWWMDRYTLCRQLHVCLCFTESSVANLGQSDDDECVHERDASA